MKKLVISLIVFTILAGCTKQEPEPEVTFTLNISGFNITVDDFSSIKSAAADVFDGFYHVYGGAEIIFENSEGAEYTFNTGNNDPDGYSITLTVGTYQISGQSIEGSSQGRAYMSYTIPNQQITITEATSIIGINVTPTCGMILVADASTQVANAYIQRPSIVGTWLFGIQGIFRFTYFIPESSYHSYIEKKDGAVLDFTNSTLQLGYVYKVLVTETGGGMIVDYNPAFEVGETILW